MASEAVEERERELADSKRDKVNARELEQAL